MDRETAVLLKGLHSYKSSAPLIAKSIPQRIVNSPVSCLQNFTLSETDFRIFSERVVQLGGLIEKDEVNLNDLISKMSDLVQRANVLNRKILKIREDYGSLNSEIKITTSDLLNEALEGLAWTREEYMSFGQENVEISTLMNKLRLEVGRDTDYVIASTKIEEVKEALAALGRTNFDRITREIIHKHNVDSEKEGHATVPAHIGTLQSSIAELKNYFPCLSKVSAYGDSLTVELRGVRIILGPASIEVDGDPAALKVYMEGGSSLDKTGDVSLRRRRRNIVSSSKDVTTSDK